MGLLRKQLEKAIDELKGFSFRRSRQKRLLQAVDRAEIAQQALEEAIHRIEARQEIFGQAIGGIEAALRNTGQAISRVEDASHAYNQSQRFRRDLLLLFGRLENIEFNLEKLMNRQSLSYDVIAPQGAQDYNEYAYWMLERHKKENVQGLCEYVSSLSDEQCKDAYFLETNLIPRIGLAKGELGGSGVYHTWPAEVDFLRGGSMQMIQMPSQVAPYLAWLANSAASVKNYLEIGVYRGGSFVLFAEWLRRFSSTLTRVACVDPLKPSPTINAYFNYLENAAPHIATKYVQDYSTSQSFQLFVKELSPDLVFIDGDHSYQSVKHDFGLIKEFAKIIAFHDIVDPTSPGPVQLWKEIKEELADQYEWVEFTKTYPSWSQNMGIGVLKLRRPPV